MEAKTQFGCWRLKMRLRRIMKIAVILPTKFKHECMVAIDLYRFEIPSFLSSRPFESKMQTLRLTK